MKRTFLIIILMVAVALTACAEGEISITAPHEIAGYAMHDVTVNCPAAGDLNITLLLGDQPVYVLEKAAAVTAGVHTFQWDGLAAWDRRIDADDYTLRATLTTADDVLTADTEVHVGRDHQALMFALPMDTVLYHHGDWALECKLVRSGKVIMDVYNAAGELIGTRVETAGSSEPFVWQWGGKLNDEYLPAGEYTLRLYAEKNPDYIHELPLIVAEEDSSEFVVDDAQPITPGMTDDLLWQAMQVPVTVAKVNENSRQKLYAAKDTGSRVLGEVYGQRQCMTINAVEGDWAQVRAWRYEDGAPVTAWVQQNRLKSVGVKSDYGIVIDIASQLMTVYYKGARIGEVAVATGIAMPESAATETTPGVFLTGMRKDNVTENDRRYDYALPLQGNRGFRSAGKKDIIGEKSTTGGIALAYATDESVIDAYWLWTHIPANTRVVIIDDAARRVQDVYHAAAGKVWNPDALRIPEAAQPAGEGVTVINITLGGDAVLGTREAWWNSKISFNAYLQENGYDYPFSGLKHLFEQDDMTFVNLEGVLKDNNRFEDTEKLVRFRGLPEYTEILLTSSIEKVNVANNHHIDYGTPGRESTIAALEAAGIPYSGYGHTYIWEYKGHKIGFAGCRETIWLRGKENVAGEITALRAAGCEVVIYSCHWGKEYSPTHNETQLAMLQAVIDAGADIVVGAHPHVVQGVEHVDGTLVLYSLGNLMFGGTHDMKTFDGVLAHIGLRFDEDGYMGATLRLTPVLTSSTPGVNDYHPVPAEGEDAARILAKIQADSDILLGGEMFFAAE